MRTIKALIPADGWTALIEVHDEDSGDPIASATAPVVAWAAMNHADDPDRDYVDAIIIEPGGWPVSCSRLVEKSAGFHTNATVEVHLQQTR